MSRVGKKAINIGGVTVTKSDCEIIVKGKLGELRRKTHPSMNIEINGNELLVKRPNDLKVNRALHGLTRALIQNMIIGVTKGFTKKLEIVGVGYKAELKGKNVLFNLGYSHPIYFIPPKEVNIQVPQPTQIVIDGIDKELVGLVAAKIRSFKKPEPYKGKGIRYEGEVIVKKAGKTGATA